MFNNFKIDFPEWKKRTVKLMFPDVINPICFVDKKIPTIAFIVGLLVLEILLAIALSEISVNLKFLMMAHAAAVLISTLIWKQPEKYDFNIQDTENLTVKQVIFYNFARGINYIWISILMFGYFISIAFLLLFPIYDGIYLYSIHIFFIALCFYIKQNFSEHIHTIKSFTDGIFTVIIYMLSGFNFPYISMYGSGKVVTNFGIIRR